MVLRVNETDGYLEQLLKLVPAEAVAAYVVLLGLVPPDEPLKYWGSFAVGLILVVIIRYFWTEIGNEKSTDISVVIISVIAYIIWVYNMDGPFKVYNLYDPWLGAVLLIVFTMIAPKIFVKFGIPFRTKYATWRKTSHS
jgi:hypothetical protein